MNRKAQTSWPLVKLGDHVDLLTGFPFKSAEYTEDKDGVRLVRGDNVAQGYLRWDGVKRWRSSEVSDFEKYSLELGDVILAMDRPWIEAGLKYAWVTRQDLPSLLVQRVTRMRGVNGLTTDYLRYVIADLSFTHYIEPIVTGVAVPHISATQIQSYSFRLPPLETQRRIASILSAYDDLIENNTRRIKILEQVAQAIYHEWFVEFRAPGVKLRKATSEEQKATGKDRFPVGWEIKPLKDLCEQINYGYTASAQQEPIGPKFLRITDIVPYLIDWDSVPHCEIEGKDVGKYRLAEGDIVIARTGATTGYAKRLNKLHPEAVFASYLVRVRVKSEHSNRLISLIVESDNYKRFIKANLGGAAQPQANAQVLTSLPVVIPPQSIQESFDRLVEDIFDQREVLQVKNANLRQTRDLLLPRLVSGEINVENIAVEV